MNFNLRPITQTDAQTIAGWIYTPPYNFYNWNPTDDPGKLLTSIPPFFVADDDDERLAGFVCFGAAAQVPGGHEANLYDEDLLDVGLGLRPDLTGRGLGQSFLAAALTFATTTFHPAGFRLTVAAFNERAIRVYKRAGFEERARFLNVSHGIETEFIVMRCESRALSTGQP
jgi:[ribosomal protein S18]-alanine N-acetyltransferase